MRHLLLRLFRVVLVLALLTALWGGWYLAKRGLSRDWRDRVTEEFRRNGIDVRMRKLTLDPINGLIAREVRIVDERKKRRAYAQVDRLALDINFSNLLFKKAFLNGLELRDARVFLPLDPTDRESDSIEISGLNAKILFPPGQLYLNHAEARILGMNVTASGRLLNPGVWAERERGDSGKRPLLEWIQKAEVLMREAKYEYGPPRLDLRFRGDLMNASGVTVEMNLDSGAGSWGNAALSHVSIGAVWERGTLNVQRFEIGADHGELNASGRWNPKETTLAWRLRSTLNPSALLSIFPHPQALKEIVFFAEPRIELQGEADIDSQTWQVFGKAETGRVGVRSVVFDRGACSFLIKHDGWYVDGVELEHRQGRISGSALFVPQDFRVRVKTSVPARELLALTNKEVAQRLGLTDRKLKNEPAIREWEIRGSSPEPGNWRMMPPPARQAAVVP